MKPCFAAGWKLALGLLAALTLAVPSWSQEVTVVELFTSKFCPNCRPAEIRMAEAAKGDGKLLILQQHVDYWDRSPTQKDPFGLSEATQRQYDYSNTVGRRPGEVFTPMPLLNGRHVAAPPLAFGWERTLTTAKQDAPPARLTLQRSKDGAVEVALPADFGTDDELWLMGVEPIEEFKDYKNLRRVRAIKPMNRIGATARLAKALVPNFEGLVVLWQAPGPGAVKGVGQSGF